MPTHTASPRSFTSLPVGLTVLVAAVLLALPARADEPEIFDAKVTRSTGEPTWLSAYWGKPTLLFYEHPDALAVNQSVKSELKRLGEVYQLRDLVRTVAVIDLEDINWWPARGFALNTMRAQEKKVRIPVLADLTGALRKGPWKLDGKASTILVLSPKGELLFRASGRIEGETFEELKETLRGLLDVSAAR